MSENVMLREAIDAVSRGQRRRARDLFTRFLRAGQAHPTYWLWMSSLVDSPKERRYCLQNVLQLDPGNKNAKRGLVLMGIIPPSEDVKSIPPIHRKWSVIEMEAPATPGLQTMLSKASWRTWGFAGVGILLVGLLLLGFFGSRNRAGALAGKLTITPKPSTPRPTATLLPTNTPWAKTPTPTFVGPIPLWMLLEATYTPTPLYIETPHPISEAYRAGLRALHAGDLTSMLQFMQQAAKVEPQAADAHYYVGEAYRLMGQFEKALEAYEIAIQAAPGFGPAYLGRARAQRAIKPNSDVSEDLNAAIEKDPFLADAYLEKSTYLLSQGEPEAALEDLHSFEELNPVSPLLFLYRAQAYLALSDSDAALENAQRAYELDLTLLPAYLFLGKAHLDEGYARKAIGYLETYLLYEKKDPQAWAALGRALFESGKMGEALEALDKAIELDEELAESYLYRGLIYLDMEEGQTAVNDFFEARRLDPESFAANLGMGRALWIAGRINDAVNQISSSQDLVETDQQLAQVYYWRAAIYAGVGNFPAAIKDWEALLVLPHESVPETWLISAQDNLLALTPSPTPTATSTPTFTPTETSTKLPTPIPTTGKTKTVTPSPSSSPQTSPTQRPRR